MKKKLFCFIGKPGGGKSTLLANLGVQYLDILPYIQKYMDESGTVTDEANVLQAYEEFFIDLEHDTAPIRFLELGISYPELVMGRLSQVSAYALVFFCVADESASMGRCMQRRQKIGAAQLLERLARPFPEQHIKAARQHNIAFYILDMGRDVQSITREVKAILF